MGLFNFVQDILGAKNDYQATPAQIQQSQYGGNIQDAYSQQNQQNDQQSQLASQLQQAAQGNGPSIVQQQLGNALGQAQNTAASQMAGARGLNPALAARLIGQNQAGQAQQAAGQSAMLKAQEQIAARQQLGDVLANQRAGNMSMYGTAGGLQNQQNATNVQNTLGVQGINSGVAATNQAEANQLGGSLLGAGAAASMMGFGGMKAKDALQLASTIAGHSGGGYINGHQEVQGDSPKNDNVPAMLSAGEIVIPKSAASSKEKAKEFIEHLMSQKEAAPRSGYARVAHAQQQLHARLEKLEKMFGGGYV